MKKHIFLGVLLMLTGFFFIPSKTFAFQHAYESKSDFIYALARNELPVYYSDYSNDLKTVLPKYTGVKVIGSSGSWYEIQYASKKGGTKNGWVTRDEFHSDCLIYDGREKQPFSNGTYQLSFYEENSSDSSFAMNTASIISENFSCSFKYAFKAMISVSGALIVLDEMPLMVSSDCNALQILSLSVSVRIME